MSPHPAPRPVSVVASVLPVGVSRLGEERVAPAETACAARAA